MGKRLKLSAYFLFALYSLFAFVKSIIILILIYTDDYFYKWEFNNLEQASKLMKFQLLSLFIPFAIGILLIIFLRKRIGLKIIELILVFVLALLILRFIDVEIRWLLQFTSNHITNAFINLIVFGFLSLIFWRKFFKKELYN